MNSAYSSSKIFFIAATLKVYDTNEDILSGLKKSGGKYKAAMIRSKEYIQICFTALLDVYKQDKPNAASRNNLLKSFKHADNQYTQVLSKDRTTARYFLKALTNFMAALTLGLAHSVHYKKTGTAAFFLEQTPKINSEKLILN